MRNLSPLFALAVAILAGLFSGCVAPATYRVRAEAETRVREYQRIVVAPPDVEVREISAGGVAERRDEWSARVGSNLSGAVSTLSRYTIPNDGPIPAELAEVRALSRLIALNHISYLFAPDQLSSTHRPLRHSVGRIDALADAWGADAVLLIFARDAYSSGGRKALVALGFAQPAPAIASAMLVGRDGEVLWMNYHFAQNIDLREPAGAQAIAQVLLAGLPRRQDSSRLLP